MYKKIGSVGLGFLMFFSGLIAQGVQAETGKGHKYETVQPVGGVLTSVGSDPMVYLISFWAVEFKRLYPKVVFGVEQAGSSTAPPALLSGEANLAPMSRPMKEKEIAAFEAKYGYLPTEIRVALDTLAVYVNHKNPLAGLTFAQVDAVFSSTRRCGQAADITRWDELGLSAEWAGQKINLYGRNLLSGTRSFFAENALCKGDYKRSLQMKSTSTEVVSAVSAQLHAIGYSGVSYQRPGVRVLPLSRKAGEPFVEATPENAYSGRYPLTRFLYLYVNKAPQRPLPALEHEFVRFVLSAQGQAIVENDGFIPLSAELMKAELAKLE